MVRSEERTFPQLRNTFLFCSTEKKEGTWEASRLQRPKEKGVETPLIFLRCYVIYITK